MRFLAKIPEKNALQHRILKYNVQLVVEIEINELDRIDYRIMRALCTDGRISDVAMGESVGLSSNAVARRRRLLEERGYIDGYGASLNLDRLGLGITVIVQIELNSQSDQALQEFERSIQACQSVSKCWFVSGDIDFLVLVHVPSLHAYDDTYRNELSNLPNVARIRSSFVLRDVIARTTAPRALAR